MTRGDQDVIELPPGYQLIKFRPTETSVTKNYGFVAPDGSKKGSHPSRSEIIERAWKHHRKATCRDRVCISWGCNKTFKSEHSGVRMCDECRSKSDGLA